MRNQAAEKVWKYPASAVGMGQSLDIRVCSHRRAEAIASVMPAVYEAVSSFMLPTEMHRHLCEQAMYEGLDLCCSNTAQGQGSPRTCVGSKKCSDHDQLRGSEGIV